MRSSGWRELSLSLLSGDPSGLFRVGALGIFIKLGQFPHSFQAETQRVSAVLGLSSRPSACPASSNPFALIAATQFPR